MARIPLKLLVPMVAVGVQDPHDDKGISWVGSAFRYGYFLRLVDDRPLYRIFLITARHVVEGEQVLFLRINPTDDGRAHDSPISIDLDKNAVFHPNDGIDLAVIALNVKYLQENKLEYDFYRSNADVVRRKDMKDLHIHEGNEVFAFGFPLGITGINRKHVIVRGGVIASAQECLNNEREYFWIDAQIYPGNSGGPVLSIPSVVQAPGSPAVVRCFVIGVMSRVEIYAGEQEASMLDGSTERVEFIELSGLVRVLPFDYVDEAIQYFALVNPDVLS